MAINQITNKHLNKYFILAISYLGLVYAVLGAANQNYFHWVNSFWLSSYSEKITIIIFGIWRVSQEKNPYTRKRLAVLTFLILTIWTLFPILTGSDLLNHHVIGSVWFFVYLGVIFLVGRRADCAWNCPCVGIRDTAGNAFRSKTIKKDIPRFVYGFKWLFLAGIIVYLVLIFAFPRSTSTLIYTGIFWQVNLGLYFLSLLVIPLTGNRNYCRFLCPWGTLYGLVSRFGFFKIVADREKCIDCKTCEAVCDMGVPIKTMIKEHGEIRTMDCVGCGRCVSHCPKNALKMVDFRDTVGSWMDKIKPNIP